MESACTFFFSFSFLFSPSCPAGDDDEGGFFPLPFLFLFSFSQKDSFPLLLSLPDVEEKSSLIGAQVKKSVLPASSFFPELFFPFPPTLPPG